MWFLIYKNLPFIISPDSTYISPCLLAADKVTVDEKRYKFPDKANDIRSFEATKAALGIMFVDGLNTKTGEIVKTTNKTVSSIDHEILNKMTRHLKPHGYLRNNSAEPEKVEEETTVSEAISPDELPK